MNTIIGVIVGAFVSIATNYITNKTGKRQEIHGLFKYALDLTNSDNLLIKEKGIILLEELIDSKITQKANLKMIELLLTFIYTKDKIKKL